MSVEKFIEAVNWLEEQKACGRADDMVLSVTDTFMQELIKRCDPSISDQRSSKGVPIDTFKFKGHPVTVYRILGGHKWMVHERGGHRVFAHEKKEPEYVL